MALLKGGSAKKNVVQLPPKKGERQLAASVIRQGGLWRSTWQDGHQQSQCMQQAALQCDGKIANAMNFDNRLW